VHIRRGDDPKRGFPVNTYLRILEALFDGHIPGVSAIPNETHIMIISETSWDDPEFLAFDKLRSASKVDFRLGDECVQVHQFQNVSHCFSRLVSDMDCMTTSDILLGSHGAFSSAVRAMQLKGKSPASGLDIRWAGSDNIVDITTLGFGREPSKVSFQPSTDMPNTIDVFVS